MLTVKLIVVMLLMAVGYVMGEDSTPELVERPQIEGINKEEFHKIDNELRLTDYVENIKVNNEGEVVFVKDKKYGKTYKVVEGEGDIGYEDYISNRKEYVGGLGEKGMSGVKASVGVFIGVIVLYDALVNEKRME